MTSSLLASIAESRKKRQNHLVWGMWGGLLMSLLFGGAFGSILYRLPESGELGYVAAVTSGIVALTSLINGIVSASLLEWDKIR